MHPLSSSHLLSLFHSWNVLFFSILVLTQIKGQHDNRESILVQMDSNQVPFLLWGDSPCRLEAVQRIVNVTVVRLGCFLGKDTWFATTAGKLVRMRWKASESMDERAAADSRSTMKSYLNRNGLHNQAFGKNAAILRTCQTAPKTSLRNHSFKKTCLELNFILTAKDYIYILPGLCTFLSSTAHPGSVYVDIWQRRPPGRSRGDAEKLIFLLLATLTLPSYSMGVCNVFWLIQFFFFSILYPFESHTLEQDEVQGQSTSVTCIQKNENDVKRGLEGEWALIFKDMSSLVHPRGWWKLLICFCGNW